MVVDEEGKVIGRPEDFTEFKLKHEDKLIELFKDKEMVEDLIYLLDEYAEFSTVVFGIGDWFEKIFRFMIKYKYQPESQTVGYINGMYNASNELRLWLNVAEDIWDKIPDYRFEQWYSFAKETILIRTTKDEYKELDKIIPNYNPFGLNMKDYADLDKIEEFCRYNVNYNLPEMVEYAKSYFGGII